MSFPLNTGTVYGCILNDAASLQALGDVSAAPYKGAPQAPVLYIKPVNTHARSGASIALPSGSNSVEVAATLGLVLGQAASRLAPAHALACVRGLVLAADLSLPHASYYRPAIREKCWDSSLVLSPVLPLAAGTEGSEGTEDAGLSALSLVTEVDGRTVDTRNLGDWLRPPAQLLAEVSQWMSLAAGDILLLGVRYQAPQAPAGSQVRVSCQGLNAAIEWTLTGEQA